MRKVNSQDRIAILDGLVRYHVEKFVELEARRITLVARKQDRPTVKTLSTGPMNRESVLVEIASIRERLDHLQGGL
jgi:hypothetical protein